MIASLPRPDCAVDAEGCIDWVFLSIGEFLKNGYTMTLLVLVLVALLRVRAKEKQKLLDRHAESMLGFDERRQTRHHHGAPSWSLQEGNVSDGEKRSPQ